MTEAETSAAGVNRIQQNLLARGERRLLNWICARLPGWVKPDQLTAIGFGGALVIAGGNVLSAAHPAWLWLAILGYFINWFGDSLDGSLARFRQIERPKYGYFLDHSVDGLATSIMAIGIGLSPFVQLEVALFVVIAYLLLALHAALAARVMSEFRLSYVGAGPTELRIGLIALALAMLFFGRAPLGHLPGMEAMLSWYDGILLLFGGILIVLFVLQTASTARALLAKEPNR